MNKTLTICIPTYNRPLIVSELVNYFVNILLKKYQNVVDILVIDNSENLETELIFSKLDFNNVSYIRNESNLGFDKNILKLYLNADSEYIWFFGDDDYPEPNSIEMILNICDSFKPDILLLPFRQPINLKDPQFQKYPDIVELLDYNKCLNTILSTGKITSYIFKKIRFDNDSILRISKFDDCGWMHIVISLELLFLNKGIKVLTFNQFCANCRSDKDIENLQWVPTAFLNFQKLLNHEFFCKIKIEKNTHKIFDNAYRNGIIITAYGSSGIWNVYNQKDYIEFGKTFPFRKSLLYYPFYLLLWMLIKSGNILLLRKILSFILSKKMK